MDPVDLTQFTVITDGFGSIVNLHVICVVKDSGEFNLNAVTGVLEEEQTRNPLGEDGTINISFRYEGTTKMS